MSDVYNVTIPHSSPIFSYDYDQWFADCPSNVCSADIGSHFTNVTGSDARIHFWGRSVYVYGSVETGMELTATINSRNIPLTPSNGILLSIDDITTICTGTTVSTCIRDQSFVDPTSSSATYGYNTLVLTTTQYVVGSRARINKVVFGYGTQRIGGTNTLKTYTNTDPAIRYTTGWTKNGTYMQSGTTLAQNMNLAFDGQAIWVWGFCGQRERYDFSSYGTFTVNGNDDYISDSSGDGVPRAQDPKCLLDFRGNLPSTGNTLRIDSRGLYNVMIDSIDVLQVSGGNAFVPSSTNPFSTRTPTSNPTSRLFGKDNGTPLAVMVAVPVAVILLVIAGGVIAAVLLRSSRKRRKAGTVAPTVAGAGANAQYKPMESPSITQTVPSMQYAPTPPTVPVTNYQYPAAAAVATT